MSVTPWLADAWTQLAARRAAARFPHAVLVAGPAGLGKREFVAALAAALLCTAPGADGLPCGRCRGCAVGRGGLASGPGRDHLSACATTASHAPRSWSTRSASCPPALSMRRMRAGGRWRRSIPPTGSIRTPPTRCSRPWRSRRPTPSSCWSRIEPDAPAGDHPQSLPAGRGPLPGPGPGAGLAGGAGDRRGRGRRCAGAGRRQSRRRAGVLPRRRARTGARGRERPGRTAARARAALGTGAALGQGSRGATGRDRGTTRPQRGVADRPPIVLPAAAVELARLTAGSDFPKLSAWWDRANRVRAQLRTPLRADLILLELLRDWRALAPVAKRA